MRFGIALRQIGTILSIDCREDRILAARVNPARRDGLGRHTHRVCRLMTGHTAATVRANGFEECMSPRFNPACSIEDSQPAVWVVIRCGRRKAAPVPRSP